MQGLREVFSLFDPDGPGGERGGGSFGFSISGPYRGFGGVLGELRVYMGSAGRGFFGGT